MANNFDKYWLRWLVTEEDESLRAFDFELVNKFQKGIESDVCLIPLTWYEDQINREFPQHILRTVRHRPRNPYELVEFIKFLNEFLGVEENN